MAQEYFEINNKDMVSEVIDGEAVLINMSTGVYFSLDGSGGVIWESLLLGPASIDTLSKILANQFEGEKSEIAHEVSRLIIEMEQHGVVQRSEAEVEREISKGTDSPARFIPPVIQIYTDLEDLLLLDPIHDVSDKGWPDKKTDEE